VLDQLAQGSSFYNESITMPLAHAVNVSALEDSVNAIVRRHEILRTTFKSTAGEPVQVIAPSLAVPLHVIELSDVAWHLRESEVLTLLREEARRPFDLVRGPLIRTQLLRLGEQDHLFVLTLHHIVYDGWSMGVFAWELTTFYEAYGKGIRLTLPDLPIQYSDFAVWQRELLEGDALASHVSYWRNKLAGLAVLQLPTDRPRPVMQTFNGARQLVDIPESLCHALTQVSQVDGATLFMILLAAFQTLLHRYSGQNDIAVGVPVANRNRQETEGLIGFFVNILVMRTDFSGDPTFRELLHRVRDVTLGAFAHEDLTFEKLVEELQPARDPSRNPLFQVSFQLFKSPSATYISPTQIPAVRSVDTGSVKFDLRFDLLQAAQGLHGYLDYNTDLFDSATVARMAAHFTTLLKGIVADPERRLSELTILTEAEREQLLVTWNQTDAEYPRDTCIHDQFAAQAERTPDALAVASGNAQLTYRELNCRANQLANYLAANGVGPGVLGAVCLERSIEMVVAMLGILKAGGAYVPLDPSYPAARLRFMLDDAQAPVLVTRRAFRDRFLPASSRTLCIDSDWGLIAAESSDGNPQGRVTAGNLAYVIYTSGSTGQPKGVEIRHSSLMNLVSWHQRVYEVTSADRTSQVAGPAFDAAAWELWPNLAAGASVHIADEQLVADPSAMLAWLAERAITICFLPTLLAESVLQNPWPSASPLRVLLTGGDALHSGSPANLPFKLQNHYGPTENTVVTTWAPVPGSQHGGAAPPIGRPISNVQVYVLDGYLQPVPIGVPGELYIGGEGLARGYHNRPELTAEKFIRNPVNGTGGSRLYKTGDLVRYRPGGDLEFLGRMDQQVKIHGFRIELGEIEFVLRQAPGVRQCVVLACDDVTGGRRLIAYVEPEEHQIPDSVALRRYLQQQLPDYLIPSAFVFLNLLPVTSNGKVDRQVLPTPEALEQARRKSHVPPKTPFEKVLANMWGEILHLEQVGVHDNFFELGGHSLLATQIASRIRDTFNIELPLRTIFESFTIAELTETVLRDPVVGPRVERTAQLLLAIGELSEDEVEARLAERQSTCDAT
jgi:amino acid adenylation domain-containing protein